MTNREVNKWEARLFTDGSELDEGVNLQENLLTCGILRSHQKVLITGLIHGLFTNQVDFVLAYSECSIVEFSNTTVASLSWLQVSRMPKCVKDPNTWINTIYNGWRCYHLHSFSFHRRYFACRYSHQDLKRRITPRCRGNWLAGNRSTLSTKWGE